MTDFQISGSFKILVLYDVAEEIRLDELRNTIGAILPVREPTFRHSAPESAHLERTPVIENIDPVLMASGERLTGRIKYYDYGVVSIELESCFEGNWNNLIELSSRWIGAPDIERSTLETVQRQLERVSAALLKPYSSWLSETIT
jgi:hypothetical protein